VQAKDFVSGAISGITSNLDIDLSPKLSRRKPPGRNFLPKINQSVVVKESRKKRDLSRASHKHSTGSKPRKKKRPREDF